MGRSRLLMRNPSLCVLPSEREEYGAMSPPVGRERQERPQLRRRLAGRSTVTITILYGRRAAGRGSSLREAVRARAGRGRKRARAGSAVTLRAKPRAGRERSRRGRPGLLPCPRTRPQATEAYEGESSPGADAVGGSADLSAGVPGARLPSLQ